MRMRSIGLGLVRERVFPWYRGEGKNMEKAGVRRVTQTYTLHLALSPLPYTKVTPSLY